MRNKIIYTIVALVILITLVIFTNKDNVVKEDINFSVEIIKEEYYDVKEFVLNNEETLIEVLDLQYHLVISSGMIMEIDEIKDYDNSKYFIEIYINKEKSNKGISSIILKDNDTLSFVLKELGDFGNVFD